MTALLRVEGLTVVRGGRRVLDDVSFSLEAGEVLGVIGESGSGKSTLAHALVRLIEPAAGAALWRGADLSSISDRELRRARREIALVFQEPATSLDPRMDVRSILAEPLAVHGLDRDRVSAVLRLVELDEDLLDRLPHQLSAGQAQRVALARALAPAPSLLIADEPFSALDVSLQAQIGDLLLRQRAALGIACLVITHDLRLAARLCDRIAVLSHGSLVESGTPAALLASASHPASRALIGAARWQWAWRDHR